VRRQTEAARPALAQQNEKAASLMWPISFPITPMPTARAGDGSEDAGIGGDAANSARNTCHQPHSTLASQNGNAQGAMTHGMGLDLDGPP
jgi:hypothetical protein